MNNRVSFKLRIVSIENEYIEKLYVDIEENIILSRFLPEISRDINIIYFKRDVDLINEEERYELMKLKNSYPKIKMNLMICLSISHDSGGITLAENIQEFICVLHCIVDISYNIIM